MLMIAEARDGDKRLLEVVVELLEAQWEPFRRTARTWEAFHRGLAAWLQRVGQQIATRWIEAVVAAEAAVRSARAVAGRCAGSVSDRSPRLAGGVP